MPNINIKIYQLKHNDPMIFRDYKTAESERHIDAVFYQNVFDGCINVSSLDDIYHIFNTTRPKMFIGHSLSVSDIISIENDGCYFVDSFGFKKLDDFDENHIRNCFEIFEDTQNIKNSLEFDSGTTIAVINFLNNDRVEIEVRGEVEINFKNEMYHHPSEFPEELKELIRTDEYQSSDDICVNMNNWFEMFYNYDEHSVVVNIEGLSKKEIFEHMLDWYETIIKENPKNINSKQTLN